MGDSLSEEREKRFIGVELDRYSRVITMMMRSVAHGCSNTVITSMAMVFVQTVLVAVAVSISVTVSVLAAITDFVPCWTVCRRRWTVSRRCRAVCRGCRRVGRTEGSKVRGGKNK